MRWNSLARLLAQLAAFSISSAAAVEADANRELDEVIVNAERADLDDMRRELNRLEDLFYARYNEVNDVDEFDVNCAEEVRKGSRLRMRYCRAVYETRALETEGRQHLQALQHAVPDPGSDEPPGEWIPPIPATVAIEMRRKEFRENLIKVTKLHPELLEPLKERAELLEQYEKARAEKF